MENISRVLTISIILCFMGSSLQAAEVLVYRNESMPWCGTVDGKDAGIAVDILNAITENGGPKFKFISVPWKRAQNLIHMNKGTALIPFTRTATREKNHTWVIKLVPNQIRLTSARKPTSQVSIPSTLTLANSKSLNIGIVRGSAIIPAMKEMGFTKLYMPMHLAQDDFTGA